MYGLAKNGVKIGVTIDIPEAIGALLHITVTAGMLDIGIITGNMVIVG